MSIKLLLIDYNYCTKLQIFYIKIITHRTNCYAIFYFETDPWLSTSCHACFLWIHTIGFFLIRSSPGINTLRRSDYTNRLSWTSICCLYFDQHCADVTCVLIQCMACSNLQLLWTPVSINIGKYWVHVTNKLFFPYTSCDFVFCIFLVNYVLCKYILGGIFMYSEWWI